MTKSIGNKLIVDSNLEGRSPDADKHPSMLRRSAGDDVEDPSLLAEDHDDDLEAFEAANRRVAEGDRRSDEPKVWADDKDQPDYAHLLVAAGAGIEPLKIFHLTPDVLDLIIRANAYRPVQAKGKIIFGIRGAVTASGLSEEEGRDRVELKEVRPDHKSQLCIIGIYDTAARKLSCYQGSTAPWHVYMTSYIGGGDQVNCLPTGCYIYRVGGHKYDKATGAPKTKPALRMTEPGTKNTDAACTVLRSKDNMTFTHDDLWHLCTPVDNVHCAYGNQKFSSMGCQVLKGTQDKFGSPETSTGPWKSFQSFLIDIGAGTHVGYVLMTGREAAIAAAILAAGRQHDDVLVLKCLGRMRTGSEGEAVTALQKTLGFNGTGYFGAATRFEMVKTERAKGMTSDSIFSPEDDQKLEWRIFTPAYVRGYPAIPGGQGPDTAPPPMVPPNVPNEGAGEPVAFALDSLIFVSGKQGAITSLDRRELTVPGEGTWRIERGSGRVSFVPVPGFQGRASPVVYQISDIYGQTATATLTVDIAPPAPPPALAADTALTTSGRVVVIAVLANDVATGSTIDPSSVRMKAPPLGATLSPDRNSLEVPGEGKWRVMDDGGITFEPLATFVGEARALYEAADMRGQWGEANVTVNVSAPATPPTALDDTGSGGHGAPVIIDVLANDRPGQMQTGTPTPQPKPETQGGTPPPLPKPEPQPSPVPADTGAVPPTPAPGMPEPPPGLALTAELIRRIAPNAKDGYVNALVTVGNELLTRHGINKTPLRLAHFLAQISHESGGFTITEENMKYQAKRICEVWPSRFPTLSAAMPFAGDPKKLACKVYGGRLGNSPDNDDGWRYRGRGLVQITGRESYRIIGRLIGADLEANPDLASDPATAVKIAVATWMGKPRKMNELADANNINTITRMINGGHIGLADRIRYFEKAWSILGSGGPPVAVASSDAPQRGDSGPECAKVQRLLVKVGMLPKDEEIDGNFGPKTEKALMMFQASANLNVDGIAGKQTMAALEAAPEAPYIGDAAAGAGRRSMGRRDGADGPRGEGGFWSTYGGLIGVLFLVFAAAIFAIASTWGEKLGLDLMRFWIASGTALALAFVFMIGGWFARRRVGVADPQMLAGQAARPHDPAWIDQLPLPAGTPQMSFQEPGPVPPARLAALEHKLKQLGFDERHFAEDEPIRAATGVPEADGGDGADFEPGELVPSGSINPVAPNERRDTAEVKGSAAPFPVSVLNPPFAILAMFGGDNNLTQQVRKDLEEMAAGTSRHGGISVLALADTEDGPGQIIEVTPRGEIRTIATLSEIDTGDPETLASFLSRALATYPNSKKAIGFWDHGTGVFDEGDEAEIILKRTLPRRAKERRPARRLLVSAAQRAQAKKSPAKRAMLHDNSGGVLTNLEAGAMLKAAFGRAGIQGKVDIIYSDTCLNGMVEVIEELGPFAHCFVASCDTEPGMGWDYTGWFQRMAAGRSSAPEDWARDAVQSFADSYRTATQHYPCTLSAFRGENDITERFADLVVVAESRGMSGFSLMNLARSRSQPYDNRDSFDLADFCRVLSTIAASSEPGLAAAAANVVAAIDAARIDSVAFGNMVTRCNGIAFWFPSSSRNLALDIGTYRRLKFARDTRWAEYLEAMYGADMS